MLLFPVVWGLVLGMVYIVALLLGYAFSFGLGCLCFGCCL